MGHKEETLMQLSTQNNRCYPTKPSDVYLFATCLIDQFTPQAGVDTVRLLEREGIQVHYLPDGHFKIPHLWPVKFPQAGRLNYQLFVRAASDFLSW